MADNTNLPSFSAGSSLQDGDQLLIFKSGKPPAVVITAEEAYSYFAVEGGTSAAIAAGTVELGHATDTTIARASAGHVNVEGQAVLQQGYTTTATAAGTTVLTVASTWAQFFTGSTTQTVTMPVVSTLVLGQTFLVVNKSSGIVTVRSSGTQTILAQAAATTALYTCILITGTDQASWNAEYVGFDGKTGTGSVVLATSPVLVTPALGVPSSGTLTTCSGLPNSGVLGPMVRSITQTILASAFADAGGGVGTKTMTGNVPAGAILLGMKLIVEAGFTGTNQTDCVLIVGDGSDTDRYMTGTPTIFTTAATGIQMGIPSGNKAQLNATQPVLTFAATGSPASATNIIAGPGSLTISLYFIDTV